MGAVTLVCGLASLNCLFRSAQGLEPRPFAIYGCALTITSTVPLLSLAPFFALCE